MYVCWLDWFSGICVCYLCVVDCSRFPYANYYGFRASYDIMTCNNMSEHVRVLLKHFFRLNCYRYLR